MKSFLRSSARIELARILVYRIFCYGLCEIVFCVVKSCLATQLRGNVTGNAF